MNTLDSIFKASKIKQQQFHTDTFDTIYTQKHDEGEHDKILANIEMVKRASADCKSCFDTDEDLRVIRALE